MLIWLSQAPENKAISWWFFFFPFSCPGCFADQDQCTVMKKQNSVNVALMDLHNQILNNYLQNVNLTLTIEE